MTHDSHASTGSHKPAILVIGLLIAGYLIAAALGLPQQATRMIVGEGDHAATHAAPAEKPAQPAKEELDPLGPVEIAAQPPHEVLVPPGILTVLPFVLLLGAIAILPLVPAASHWWEHNRNRLLVAVALGGITLLYYLLVHQHPIHRHFLGHELIAPNASGPSIQLAWTVFQNAIFGEYIPFIILLFSLYTISGGCRISGDLPAHPITNTTFLAVGAFAASFVGTTGAAMLLIRPLLETNSERKYVAHTAVFFIFLVCNCGGCLLPIGDPPLFLGYLAGVDFLWTLKLWPEWLTVNLGLLIIYFAWDYFYAYPREAVRDIRRDEATRIGLRFEGLLLNGALLVGVILSVALLDPSKAFLGTSWHPWLYLREAVQLLLVAISLTAGSSRVRAANRFNFLAIGEVAALFLGIFICMQPALQILAVRGPTLGIETPAQFFWATGALSSVLDNAPTYLVFFQTAETLSPGNQSTMAGVTELRLAAISLGAVFMGAMTYIGNGPNFMVKSIADSAGVKTPSFFGYVFKYSLPILFPILALGGWLFL